MSDLTAGSPITALDTPPTQVDTQDDLFTFDGTTFGTDNDSGTYNDCAVVFMACTTGKAEISYAAELDGNGATVGCNVAPVVREGNVVGSGATVLAADLARAIRHIGTDSHRHGATYTIEGLTPGDEYNVRLEHRVNSGIGTIQYRHLSVKPVP